MLTKQVPRQEEIYGTGSAFKLWVFGAYMIWINFQQNQQ
jgi:hypothetical protein